MFLLQRSLGTSVFLGVAAVVTSTAARLSAIPTGTPAMPSASMMTARAQGNHSITGNMCAAARALESRRPDRLFDDPLAARLAGDAPPMGDWIMTPRTRYDLIADYNARGAARQLVLLGAGMDTRAFRLDTLQHWTVFEVDLPETFAVKEPLLVVAKDTHPTRAPTGVPTLPDEEHYPWAPAVSTVPLHGPHKSLNLRASRAQGHASPRCAKRVTIGSDFVAATGNESKCGRGGGVLAQELVDAGPESCVCECVGACGMHASY